MKDVIIISTIILIFVFLFYFLRVETYFLGDGYQAISLLDSNRVLLKDTEIGEMIVHIWTRNIISGFADNKALLSFQLISIFSGVFTLIIAGILSAKLFETTIKKIIFILGLASGGFTLLYYGYVEYYSLFISSVVIYGISGLLILNDKMKLWLVIPLNLIAIFFHILGVVLIPASIFLFLIKSSFWKRKKPISASKKYILTIIALVIIVPIFMYCYYSYYFFRFSIIPLFADRFTVGNYTLFSINHTSDYINLLLLLCPALPLAVVYLSNMKERNPIKSEETTFLALFVSATCGAAFLFDPKLGMPRDWDLFAFAGVALTISIYYLAIQVNKDHKRLISFSVFAVSVSLVSLFSRIGVLNSPDLAISHIKSYFNLDRLKNKNSRILLVNYYNEKGDSLNASAEYDQWNADFPDIELVKKARSLGQESGKQEEAIKLMKRVIEYNPINPDAWAGIGKFYLDLKRYDSSLSSLLIADGLRPNHPNTISNLGTAYAFSGDKKTAEKMWKKSIFIDSTDYGPIHNLILLYDELVMIDEYEEYIILGSRYKEAPLVTFKSAGDIHLRRKEYEKAAIAYKMAIRKGMALAQFEILLLNNPMLKEYFKM